MTRVEIAPEVTNDFERTLDHVTNASARMQEIIQALDVLTTNPEIGRPTSAHMRELVIGRATRGYVALYRYIEEIDTVFVLAIRAPREAGYKRP